MVKVLHNGTTVSENVYDGSGMRVKRIEDGKTVYFVYNGNEPLVEYAATEGKYTYYIYADEKAIAEESGGVVKFYHRDHLGSTRVITDSLGTKIAGYTYEPFGKVIAGADGKQQFTGKRQDGTGLYYFGARFYDAEVGRFLTADTYTNLPNDERILFKLNSRNNIENPKFINPQIYNRYSYCLNNPINNIDPNGHAVQFAMAAIAKGIAGGIIGGFMGGFGVILGGLITGNEPSKGDVIAAAIVGAIIGATSPDCGIFASFAWGIAEAVITRVIDGKTIITMITATDLPGIPKGSTIVVSSDGTITVNGKTATTQQKESLSKANQSKNNNENNNSQQTSNDKNQNN